MGTLLDLMTVIVSDLNRDDLATDLPDVLLQHIRKAVRTHAVRDWWFLRYVTTASTTASQNYVTRPTGIDRIDRVSIPSLGYELDRVDLSCIEAEDEPAGQTGQPYWWAEYGDNIRLYPTPNAVFSVKFVGTRRHSELSGDSDTNPWTNEAADLIAAQAKATLLRDVIRDDAAFARAMNEVQQALDALRSTNISRLSGPVKAGW